MELAIKHELQAGSPGPPGDPNWRLLYYQGEVKVEFEGGPSPHPKPRCTLPLDPIAVSTVDVEALHQWAIKSHDNDLMHVLRYIAEGLPPPFSFRTVPSRAQSGPGPAQSGVSRGFSPSDAAIINTISEPCGDLSFAPLPLFKVPKKSGKARLVQDGRTLNQAVETPPKMKLPPLDAIISRASSHPHMAQADATSFFYQLPLARRLRPLFSFNVGILRGPFSTRQLIRIPMGFSHAPYVAQTIANAICAYALSLTSMPGISIQAWIDNFIIAAATPAALVQAKEALRAAFRHFRLQASWVSSNEVLGLNFSKTGVCLARDFIEKSLGHLRPRETMTAHQVAKMMGCIIWASITTIRVPLACFHPLLRLLQRASGTTPDTSITIGPEAAQAMSTWRDILRRNARFIPAHSNGPTDVLWTDASEVTGAAVNVRGKQASYCFYPFITSTPIFYKELLASLLGTALVQEEPPVLLTDNQALASALAKGHCTAGGPVTNAVVAEILKKIRGVGWVPTLIQQADPMTRSPRSLPQPNLLPSQSFELYQSYFLPGGRGPKERGEGRPILSINNKLQQPKWQYG